MLKSQLCHTGGMPRERQYGGMNWKVSLIHSQDFWNCQLRQLCLSRFSGKDWAVVLFELCMILANLNKFVDVIKFRSATMDFLMLTEN